MMTEKQNKKRNEKVNPSSLEVSNNDASGRENTYEKKTSLGFYLRTSAHSEMRTR